MSDHAILSPSSAHRWALCPGSVGLSKDIVDEGSEASKEGTRAHELAAQMLLGQEVTETNPEMLKHVGSYVDTVKSIRDALGGTLLVEQRFSVEAYIPGCWGTADAVIVAGEELVVIDLKYGASPRNKVVAENNPQLRLYGLGAYHAVGELLGIERVRMMIIQPRLESISEEVLTVDELTRFGLSLVAAANEAIVSLNQQIEQLKLVPGEKQCQWCKAKAICPALRNAVQQVTGCDFEDLDAKPVIPGDVDAIAQAMRKVDLIEDFCRAIRAEVEKKLVSGEQVPGFKLVEGRKGARQWNDETAVEQLMKEKFRLTKDEMYDMSLISPTTAEKRLKESPKRWQQLKDMIVSRPGKPSVVPETDKRPALKVSDGTEFEVLA